MKTFAHFAGLLLMVAVVVGGAGCSDSPTESGSAPVISQLQAQSAQRISGNVGVVQIRFAYADPDADIDRYVFQVTGEGLGTHPLDDADQSSGVVTVLQSMDLPATGTEVTFTIFVLDRRGNRSNSLDGSFVAP